MALTLQDATVADGVVGQDASSTTARQESRLGLISLSCRAARVDSGALRYGIRQYFWL